MAYGGRMGVGCDKVGMNFGILTIYVLLYEGLYYHYQHNCPMKIQNLTFI